MVSDLGVMRLAKLSGLLTRDRVECQLNKLKTLRYLIDHVSGMTGKYLLGATVGAFFLNVFKAELSTVGEIYYVCRYLANILILNLLITV